MAKKEQVQQVEVSESAKTSNIVVMDDGTTKNFGKCGKLLSTGEVTDNGFMLTFHVANGKQIDYKFQGTPQLLQEMAKFGADSKIKAACAGATVDNIETIILNKLEEFNAGQFVSRVTGELTTTLSQIQLAYAIVNDIDIGTPEGLMKINAIFAAFNKEEKSNLYKDARIKLQLAKLKLEAAEAVLKQESKN